MAKNPTESQWLWISAFAGHLRQMSENQRNSEIRKHLTENSGDKDLLDIAIQYLDQPPAIDRDRTGEKIDSYKLMSRLGHGGMGEVYVADEYEFGKYQRTVALKLIVWPPALSSDEKKSRIQRFEQEVENLAKIESENVVTLYKAGTYKDAAKGEEFPYLVMRHVDQARSLTDYIKQAGLNTIEKLKLFLKVCEGVRQIHTKDLIHCDLKPANILVDSDGNPRVADFGLVKLLGDGTERGPFGMAEGSPAYMSPEQVSDHLGDITKKTDVYALGLILFEMLTDNLPYEIPKFEMKYEVWQTKLRNVITQTKPKDLDQNILAEFPGLGECVSLALKKSAVDRTCLDELNQRIDRIVNLYHQTVNAALITPPVLHSNPSSPIGNSVQTRKINNLKYLSLQDRFVGRAAFLNKVHKAFKESKQRNAGRSKPQVIFALGGVGKSRTAVEYGWHFADHYSSLLFVHGINLTHLIRDLAEMAGPKYLNLSLDPFMLPKYKAARVLDHLKNYPGWLMIIDNVDDEITAKSIWNFLGDFSGGDLLITSRWRGWNNHHFELQKLELLDENSAAELILRAVNKTSFTKNDKKVALKLAKDLGCLSLALQQAAAYINALPTVTIAEYHRRWQMKFNALANFIPSGIYNTDEKGELLTILTTWRTSLDQLSESARWWINHLAFLASAPVPVALAKALHAMDPTPGKKDLTSTGSAVKELWDYSLLEVPKYDSGEIGQMHRLVQMVLRDEINHSKNQLRRRVFTVRLLSDRCYRKILIFDQVREVAAAVLGKWFTRSLNKGISKLEVVENLLEAITEIFKYNDNEKLRDPLNCEAWPYLDSIVPHALTISQYSKFIRLNSSRRDGSIQNCVQILNQLAALFQSKSLYGQAGRYHRKSVLLVEKYKSDIQDEKIVSTCKNNYAWWLDDNFSDNHVYINNLFEEAIDTRYKLANNFKSELSYQLSLAESYNDFANFLKNSSNLLEAESYYKKSFELRKAILEKNGNNFTVKRDYAITLLCFANLELIKYATGKTSCVKKALSLLDDCKEQMKSVYLERVQNTNGLVQGKILVVDNISYVPKDSYYAILLSNYAIYLALQNDEGAEQQFLESIRVSADVVKHSHVHTAKTLVRYASFLNSRGRIDDANGVLQKAETIALEIFNSDCKRVEIFRKQFQSGAYWL